MNWKLVGRENWSFNQVSLEFSAARESFFQWRTSAPSVAMAMGDPDKVIRESALRNLWLLMPDHIQIMSALHRKVYR